MLATNIPFEPGVEMAMVEVPDPKVPDEWQMAEAG